MRGVRAVEVENAFYRGAVLAGVFELVDQTSQNPIEEANAGRRRVQVVCAWHGVTPRTSYPHLVINAAKYQIHPSYTGAVADNISRPGSKPHPLIFPDDIAPGETFPEGAVREVTVNAYERSPEARDRCIAHHGTSCVICGFDFGRVYGTVVEGFIHVHHLKPLSEIGKEYRVDPVKDLRPVCPNCHAVLHAQKPAFSIEEVLGFLKQAREKDK